MSKFATKAASNVFYLKRYDASKFNDRLSSRDGAAEESGVDKSRLTRIELDTAIPYPEEVILLADTYNAPELMNHYCANECPIGKRTVPCAESVNLDRVTIGLLSSIEGMETEVRREILRVAADGKITEEALAELDAVCERMERVVKSFNELRILTERTRKEICRD